jgi:5'-3' exonuclease
MSKDKKRKIILFDSHAIIHRAYHALPDFTSSKGEPTGALYGLSSMLMAIINEFKPDFMIAAFDFLNQLIVTKLMRIINQDENLLMKI